MLTERKKAVALVMIRLRECGIQPYKEIVKAVVRRLPLFGVGINNKDFVLDKKAEDMIGLCVRQYVKVERDSIKKEMIRRPQRVTGRRAQSR